MNKPSPDQIAAAKSLCRERFGHERVIGIALAAPIDCFVIVSAMGMREASEYVDARALSQAQARSALVAKRCLWPDAKTLAGVRRLRGALDIKIELEVRKALGWVDGAATVHPFGAATAPPGFAAPADLAAKADELLRAYPDAELWTVTNPGNGLALVMAAPEEDVYTAGAAALGAAQQSKRGGLTCALDFCRDLIVWSPKPLDAYLEEAPGRAEDLANPFLEMGGAGATSSASFL